MHIREVPTQHIGLLYINQEFQTLLQPGIHAWWIFGRYLQTETIDLRLQTMEVSGQDILSKDKVPLRLNLTAGFCIVDPLKAKNSLSDVAGFLYKELQFALRGAVGERTLDGLLEDKGAIDRSVAEYIRHKTANYGIEFDSVGVKDIILPGEIKTILSKVVEAEKAAQANVVRRREETAATRSMLNTAKVMEDNPVSLLFLPPAFELVTLVLLASLQLRYEGLRSLERSPQPFLLVDRAFHHSIVLLP
nr:slipin family protein [Argonema galeatum]